MIGFGFGPNKKYASIASAHTNKIVMTEAGIGYFELHHADVTYAFVQAQVKEEINTELPANYQMFEGAVGKLIRSL